MSFRVCINTGKLGRTSKALGESEALRTSHRLNHLRADSTCNHRQLL